MSNVVDLAAERAARNPELEEELANTSAARLCETVSAGFKLLSLWTTT
jgi:hypothetical protein